MIDTHSHIYLPEFDADQENMLQRAREAGIHKILMPNIDSESIALMRAVEAQNPGYLRSMMGLHPCSVKADHKEVLQGMYTQLRSHEYVAIGECGMDLYWDKESRPLQEEAMRIQVQWAQETGLPLVLHSRDAFDPLYELIRDEGAGKVHGVFHCFTGTAREAQKAVDLGFYLGIGGVLTYKNSGLAAELTAVDRSRVVLETDAPYLSPVPHRGKRNEPAFVVHVAEKLAEAWDMDLKECLALTTENARRLFNLEPNG